MYRPFSAKLEGHSVFSAKYWRMHGAHHDPAVFVHNNSAGFVDFLCKTWYNFDNRMEQHPFLYIHA